MLRMGFAEDVEEILSHSPAARQLALFSATMPPAIRRVATEHMKDPVRVSVSPQSSTVSSVKQSYAVVPFRHRTGALARVLATTEAKAAIVFVRTRAAAEEVGAALIERGLIAASISGDVAQKDRERIVGRLRDGSLQVLVATEDRKSTRLNSSHVAISYAVFCLKKKKKILQKNYKEYDNKKVEIIDMMQTTYKHIIQ